MKWSESCEATSPADWCILLQSPLPMPFKVSSPPHDLSLLRAKLTGGFGRRSEASLSSKGTSRVQGLA